MESRRPVMGMPMAIGAGLAFVVAAVVIAKVFDSPLSVIILVAMVLLAYAVVRLNSRNTR
jgi:multidrug transporter EmrE-like cation transporter